MKSSVFNAKLENEITHAVSDCENCVLRYNTALEDDNKAYIVVEFDIHRRSARQEFTASKLFGEIFHKVSDDYENRYPLDKYNVSFRFTVREPGGYVVRQSVIAIRDYKDIFTLNIPITLYEAKYIGVVEVDIRSKEL